tara:strand:- start:4201 stop:5403 length:1203 start_codon:yes stop_codon:yes gene_type:complete
MANWQTKTIKEIAVLIKDGTHGTHKDVEEGIALLSAKDIDGGKVNVAPDSRVISEADFNAIHARYSLKDGDILLTIVGSLGRVAIVTNYANNYTFQRSVAILRFNNEVDTSYAYYYLTSSIFQKELLKRESKGAQGGVYLGDISKIKINIPEKPEQERIVGVLEVWDEYIEKLEQKIALKEQLKKGLMQQLLTGKRRLPGFEGDWQKLKLSDIAKIRKGTQLNRSTLSENMAGLNKYAVINGGITPSGYTDTANTKAGAITISEGGNSCGYVNYIKEDFWLGGHCYEIINNQKVDQIYLYPFLKANQSKIMSLRVGSGLPNIQKSSLENLKVLLPETKKEQEELGLIMLHSVTEIEQLSEKLQIMKLQKKYLLKNLITGTIRTPEDLQPLDTSRLERSAL